MSTAEVFRPIRAAEVRVVRVVGIAPEEKPAAECGFERMATGRNGGPDPSPSQRSSGRDPLLHFLGGLQGRRTQIPRTKISRSAAPRGRPKAVGHQSAGETRTPAIYTSVNTRQAQLGKILGELRNVRSSEESFGLDAQHFGE